MVPITEACEQEKFQPDVFTIGSMVVKGRLVKTVISLALFMGFKRAILQ